MRKKNIVVTLSCFLLILIGCSKNSNGSDDDNPSAIDKTANLLGTGESANDLLSNDKFTNLRIEIAYVTGFRPTSVAMTDFVTFIREHTFKENIELVFNELDSPEKETLSLQEIVELEGDNRTVFNEGDTLGVYIYFADAPSDGDNEEEGKLTVGAVYRNTSMIIHEITVQRLASTSPFIRNADIEIATVNHEFGHLFGLVNLGTDPVNDHEDPEAENHCIVPGCLMRSELQFNPTSTSKSSNVENGELKFACSLSGKSVLQMLEFASSKGQGIAPDLDPECILDLRANGGR